MAEFALGALALVRLCCRLRSLAHRSQTRGIAVQCIGNDEALRHRSRSEPDIDPVLEPESSVDHGGRISNRMQGKDACATIWWAMTGSNRRHPRCKRGALPTELIAPSICPRPLWKHPGTQLSSPPEPLTANRQPPTANRQPPTANRSLSPQVPRSQGPSDPVTANRQPPTGP